MGGRLINNLRYADDTVLIAKNEEDLQNMLKIKVDESSKRGLDLNVKKTMCMVVSAKTEIPKCNIKVDNEIIK